MKGRIACILILSLLFTLGFAVSLVEVTPRVTESKVSIELVLSGRPVEARVEANTSKTVYSVFLKDVTMSGDRLIFPVAVGPVEMVRVVNVGNGLTVFVNLLVPSQVSYELKNNVFLLQFPRSAERFDVVFEGMSFESVLKYLAERLNLNVVIADSVRNLSLNMRLVGVAPEDALRDVLVTLGDVSYSYFPDGTMFVGRYEEVSERFQRFWGVYRVGEQSFVEKLKALISPDKLAYLPSKSALFVYGTAQEHDLIASLISVSPPLQRREIVFTAPVDQVIELLDGLRNVYQFEYQILKPISRVILTGGEEALSKIERYLKLLEAKEQKLAEPTTVPTKRFAFYSYDPETASKLIRLLLGISAEPHPELNLVICQVPIDQEQELLNFLAENNLELSSQVFSMTISKGEEEFLKAAVEFLGVPSNRLRLLNVDGKNLRVVFNLPKKVFDGISPLLEALLRERRKGFKTICMEFQNELEEGLLAVVQRLFNVDTKKVGKFLILEGTEDDLLKAENYLKEMTKEHLKFLNVSIPEHGIEGVKAFLREKYGVTVSTFPGLNVVMLSSRDEKVLSDAAKELEELVAEQKTMKIVDRKVGLPQEVVKNLLAQVYGVSVEFLDTGVLLIGERKRVEEAQAFLDRLSTLKSEETREVLRIPKWVAGTDRLMALVASSTGVAYELLGDLAVVFGTKDVVEQAKKLFEDVLAKLGEVKEKEIAVFVDIPKDFPIDEFLNFSKEVYPEVSATKLEKLALIVVRGAQDDVQKVLEVFETFQKRFSVVYREYVFERVIFEVDSGFPFEQFKAFLEAFVSDVKQVIYLDKIGVVLVEAPASKRQKVEEVYKLFSEKVSKVSEKTERKTVPIPANLDLNEVVSYLGKIFSDLKIEAFPKLGYILLLGPKDVVERAERLIKQVEETQTKEYITVMKDKISVKAEDVPLFELIKEAARKLGISIVFADVPTEKVTLFVDNVSWDNFVGIVGKNYGYVFDRKDNAYVIYKTKQDPTRRYVYEISHNFDQVKALIEFYGGTVYVDALNNFMIVTGISETVKAEIDEIVRKISKPTKQVEISAMMVDRSLLSSLNESINIGLVGPSANAPNVNVGSGGMTFTFNVSDYLNFERIISSVLGSTLTLQVADRTQGSLGDILASPRVVTVSGKEARILIGDRIPYITDTNGDGTPEVQFLETGIELRITPYVRGDDTIEVDLFVKASEPGNYVQNIPGERTREAKTFLIVRNNSTIVIGGLTREFTNVTETKLPFLGDLPIIGRLFRTKTEEKQKRDLTIFVTVRVVEP